MRLHLLKLGVDLALLLDLHNVRIGLVLLRFQLGLHLLRVRIGEVRLRAREASGFRDFRQSVVKLIRLDEYVIWTHRQQQFLLKAIDDLKNL